MDVAFNRLSYERIEFSFSPDPMDGIPAIKKVSVWGEKVGRLKDVRGALIGYLLCRHLVGNCLNFVGLECPPYLAAALKRDFPGMELFIAPVDNVPTQILPKEIIAASELRQDDLDAPNHFQVDDLGGCFQFKTRDGECRKGRIETNAKLALVGEPGAADGLYFLIMSLLFADVLGVRQIRASGRSVYDHPETTELLKEVGVNVVS